MLPIVVAPVAPVVNVRVSSTSIVVVPIVVTPAREAKVLAADRLVVEELKRLGYTARMIIPRWEGLPPKLNDWPARIVRKELREEEHREEPQQ